jgi:hypothetical protein
MSSGEDCKLFCGGGAAVGSLGRSFRAFSILLDFIVDIA